MAFNSASGHNNLPSGNFTPEIFSQKVLKFFRRASVAEDITNTDYAGEIENFGDTVRIRGLGIDWRTSSTISSTEARRTFL